MLQNFGHVRALKLPSWLSWHILQTGLMSWSHVKLGDRHIMGFLMSMNIKDFWKAILFEGELTTMTYHSLLFRGDTTGENFKSSKKNRHTAHLDVLACPLWYKQVNVHHNMKTPTCTIVRFLKEIRNPKILAPDFHIQWLPWEQLNANLDNRTPEEL